MAGTISEDIIAEIRERADIVKIVGKRVELKRLGRQFRGLCPFHNEKSPSFYVTPERGFYHCFGCQVSGDVFKFIMETEHSPFPVVVRDLAKEVGVDIPEQEEESAEEKRNRERREWYYRVNDYINQFFVHQFWSSSDGERASEYIRKRGLSEETARTFAIGYAPRRADGLIKYLEAKRVPIEPAIELGVLGKRDDGSLYLKFFDRVMFPIYDDRDRIAGFGGRVLDPEAKTAKYLNSQESPIFKKSRLLYGFSKAKNSIARKGGAWLCEGYLDVIALHQAGLEQAIAPLGTALTDDHVPLLRRVSTKAYTMFDGDAAGLRATRKSTELLLAHGFSVYVVELPAGDDPDTLVLREGREAVSARVAAAPAAVQFFIEKAARELTPTVEGRVAAAQELGPLLHKVASQLERDLYVTEAATKLSIGEDALRQHFRAQIAPSAGSATAERPRSWQQLMGGLRTSGRSDGRTDGRGGERRDAQARPPGARPAPKAQAAEPARDPNAPPHVTPPDRREFSNVLEVLKFRVVWHVLPELLPLIAHDGLRELVRQCSENADEIELERMQEALGSQALARSLAAVLSDDSSASLPEERRNRMAADAIAKLRAYHFGREKESLLAQLQATTDLAEQQALTQRLKELGRAAKVPRTGYDKLPS